MQDYLSEYRLSSKIVSDAGTSFISERLKSFCKQLGIQHAVLSSSCSHQRNGQAAAYIKFIKATMTKCYETNADIYMSLSQIGLTLIIPVLLRSATLLLNRPVRGLLPGLSRPPIVCEKNYNSTHAALKTDSTKQTIKHIHV